MGEEGQQSKLGLVAEVSSQLDISFPSFYFYIMLNLMS